MSELTLSELCKRMEDIVDAGRRTTPDTAITQKLPVYRETNFRGAILVALVLMILIDGYVVAMGTAGVKELRTQAMEAHPEMPKWRALYTEQVLPARAGVKVPEEELAANKLVFPIHEAVQNSLSQTFGVLFSHAAFGSAIQDHKVPTSDKLARVIGEIHVASCFSGVIGKTIADDMIGRSSSFNYLTGTGRIPQPAILAFSDLRQSTISAVGIAILCALVSVNFAGGIFMIVKSCKMALAGNQGSVNCALLAVAWLMLAVVLPDVSQAVFLFTLIMRRMAPRRKEAFA